MSKTEKSPTKIITGLVRFSYVQVFTPKMQKEGGKKKYSVALLIKKTDKATIKAINAAVEAAKQVGKESKFAGKIPANLKLPLRDGDVEREDNPEYEGCYFVTASSDNKPGIVGPDKEPIIDEEEFYSGCFGYASVNFYPFNAEGSKGIACGLNNLMKVKDGERLSGGASATEDFADVEVMDEEDEEDEDI